LDLADAAKDAFKDGVEGDNLIDKAKDIAKKATPLKLPVLDFMKNAKESKGLFDDIKK
jgi:hypothetical protein